MSYLIHIFLYGKRKCVEYLGVYSASLGKIIFAEIARIPILIILHLVAQVYYYSSYAELSGVLNASLGKLIIVEFVEIQILLIFHLAAPKKNVELLTAIVAYLEILIFVLIAIILILHIDQ
jgi:hypothetical protein